MPQPLSRFSGAAAGVVFALLVFLSLAVVDPLRHASDAELLEWWSAESNLRDSVISMYLRLAAIPFGLAFLAHLRSRLHSDKDSAWSDTMSWSGGLLAAMLAVSGLARGITAQSATGGDDPLPGVDALRFGTELAYQAYGLVAIGALAIMVCAAAVLVLRTRSLPGWLGWLGLVFGALSLVAVGLQAGPLASPLLLLWVFVASLGLGRSQGATAT